MKYESKAWHYLERICYVMDEDPEELYQKGREFLRFYRRTCCVPEYALSPEPTGPVLYNRRIFLEDMEAVCEDEAGSMKEMLRCRYTPPSQLRNLVTETVIQLHNMQECGSIYEEIITRKYLQTFPMTDQEISNLMAISESSYYNKHKEACAYYMLTMLNIVLPRMKEELRQAEVEERLQPREVLYG